MSDRKSDAEVPVLIEDPQELARREAANALDQFDWGMEEVDRWIAAKKPNLKVSMLLSLHRKAMEGIDPYAGNFRPAKVAIKGSEHEPVSGDDVARYVEEMLEYVEEKWPSKTALHLCAYVMWRLNWIHPFADGNGRTSRILAYMVLCGRLEQALPGTNTIPEQISANKQPYYDALEDADKKYRSSETNVSAMEKLLEKYLANQLVDLHDRAKNGGTTQSTITEDSTEAEGRIGLIAAIEAHPAITGAVVLLIVTIAGIVFA